MDKRVDTDTEISVSVVNTVSVVIETGADPETIDAIELKKSNANEKRLRVFRFSFII